MLAAIGGFFAALPEVIELIKQFMAWINSVSGNDAKGFLRDVGAVVAQVNAAQTQEERSNAAKAVADLFSRV